MGVGAGIMFIRGFTTGGGDLCASMINRRAPRFSPGRLILIIDATIIVAASIIMQKYEILIYCLAASASYGLAVDFVINGAFICRSVFIISDMHEEIADRIIHELDRGVTVLEGEGCIRRSRGRCCSALSAAARNSRCESLSPRLIRMHLSYFRRAPRSSVTALKENGRKTNAEERGWDVFDNLPVY